MVSRICSAVAMLGPPGAAVLLGWFWFGVRRPPRVEGTELTRSRFAYETHYIAVSQATHVVVAAILATAGLAIVIRRVRAAGWSPGYVFLPVVLLAALALDLVLIRSYVWHWQQAFGWATMFFVVLPAQLVALIGVVAAVLLPARLGRHATRLGVAATTIGIAWTVPASFALSIYIAGGWRSTI
ncbi:MAG TPA: hypothetical protein VE777_17160 [Gaiellales bacterium]|nr:hypothetical protein [Gaiellales bacterium]